MYQTDDTICAISTPAGVGGIAVARISGHNAIEIANKLWNGKALSDAATHTAHLGNIIDPGNGAILDQAVATIFRTPRSFTGEDVVEFAVHGSTWIQRELINLLIRQGCRLAEAGEFTRRAFASGKMDLAEAEAVADVIASTSRAAHQVAISQMRGTFSRELNALHDQLLELASLLELELDFSEEDVEFADRHRLIDLTEAIQQKVGRLADTFSTGNAIKNGIPVAIVGAPNAGKSTLLNRLVGDDKAIVSDIPGTTRDTIEDTIEIGGIQFRLIDTAGLRHTNDQVEQLGIRRAIGQLEKARIAIWVIDPRTEPGTLLQTRDEINAALPQHATLLIAKNMADIAPDLPLPFPSDDTTVTINISAATGAGIDNLKQTLLQTSGIHLLNDEPIVTNARHYESLLNASHSISRTLSGLRTSIPADLIAQDLRETLHHLASITGTIATPDILSTIFSRFCVGK